MFGRAGLGGHAPSQIEDVLQQAIQAARPEYEHWRVTMHKIAGGGVRIYDFALGVDAPHSMTLDRCR